MNISVRDIGIPAALRVAATEETLTVDLEDGRSISVPIAWYPRLSHASASERANWRLIGRGQGIRWDDLDEDISVESILTGRASAETQHSLEKWLLQRQRPRRR